MASQQIREYTQSLTEDAKRDSSTVFYGANSTGDTKVSASKFISLYSSTRTYSLNEVCFSDQGNHFRSLQNSNLNNDPENPASATYWENVSGGGSGTVIGNIAPDPSGSKGAENWTSSSGAVATVASGLTGFDTELQVTTTGAGSNTQTIDIPIQLRGENLEMRFEGYVNAGTVTIQLFRADGTTEIVKTGTLVPSSGAYSGFYNFYASTDSTMKLKISGTNIDFRFTNIYIGRRQSIFGAAIGTETSWTPTTQGLGTITGLYARWRQVGEKLRGFITFTTGTVTASEVQIGLPNNYTSASDYPTLQVVGHYTQNSAGANAGQVLIEASKGYITLGLQSGAGVGLSKILGSALSNTTTYSLEFEVTISQLVGKGIIQLAESAGPYTISNALFTTNANETTGAAYFGEDGSAINTAIATSAKYCDINLPRALLPNESYELLFQSAIDKEWIKAQNLGVPSLGIGNICVPTAFAGASNGWLRSVVISKVTVGKLRIWWPINITGTVSTTYAEAAGASEKTWANITGAADGFLRWKIKVGPNNAVELPPKIYAQAKLTGSQALTADVTDITFTSIVKDPLSSLNVNGTFTCPIDGVWTINIPIFANNTGSGTIFVWIDGVKQTNLALIYLDTVTYHSGNIKVNLLKGQTVKLRSASGVTTANNSGNSLIEFIYEGK